MDRGLGTRLQSSEGWLIAVGLFMEVASDDKRVVTSRACSIVAELTGGHR